MSGHPQQGECHADGQSSGGELPSQTVIMSPPGRQTVWWVATVVLAVIATTLVMRWDDGRLVKSASAQSGGLAGAGQAGARGIYAFCGQLTSKSYGVFMVDVDTGTIWCYEIKKGSNNELQMRLVAARSWIFDRYLEEFNVAEPIPAAVRAMVQQQRSHREDARTGTGIGSVAGTNATSLPAGSGSQ